MEERQLMNGASHLHDEIVSFCAEVVADYIETAVRAMTIRSVELDIRKLWGDAQVNRYVFAMWR